MACAEDGAADDLQSELKGAAISDLEKLQRDVGAWSDSVFGAGRHPSACLAHLAKEISELRACAFDEMEYADCLILLIDSARMAGLSATDLIRAAFCKLKINRRRRWGKPDENGVIEHIRDTDEEPS